NVIGVVVGEGQGAAAGTGDRRDPVRAIVSDGGLIVVAVDDGGKKILAVKHPLGPVGEGKSKYSGGGVRHQGGAHVRRRGERVGTQHGIVIERPAAAVATPISYIVVGVGTCQHLLV